MPKSQFSYKKNDSTPNPPGGWGGYPQNSSIKALLLKIFSIRALWYLFSQTMLADVAKGLEHSVK